jgi:MoaA/NifB/PqqE/SkfB family radical SAM enzyme
MSHDIEGDWFLFSTCNYRCDYCFLSDSALGAKVEVRATPAEWGAAFDRTGKTWLVHITGGEPTHYPDFVDLCAALTWRHTISLNSNLTGPAILEFADRIDPAKVSFINAGMHPAERARRKGLDVFLRHGETLKRRGFPLMVTVVATPDVLHRFDEVVAQLAPIGVVPFPKMMQGRQDGRLYPDAYTEEERALFRRHSLAAERASPHLFGAWRERPSIDPPLGRKYLDKSPDYRGRLCSAGKEFVLIRPDGEVHRCGRGTPMGNLLQGDVRFKNKAKPCDRGHCFYFCEKFTARAEAQWARKHPFAAMAKRIKGALAPVAG